VLGMTVEAPAIKALPRAKSADPDLNTDKWQLLQEYLNPGE